MILLKDIIILLKLDGRKQLGFYFRVLDNLAV
jgi:hypothetical protein